MNRRRWFGLHPVFVLWFVVVPARKAIPWIIENHEMLALIFAIAALLIGLIWAVFKRVPCPTTTRTREVAHLGPVAIRHGARCLVCRHALSGDVIYCGSCHTPHHRGCFNYIGGCSVYACASRKAA